MEFPKKEYTTGLIAISEGLIAYKLVFTESSKNNVPLMVLHGGPGAPHNYLEPLEEIALNRPVIFYDQLGCGGSEIRTDAKIIWSIARFLLELENVVSFLNLEKMHLFGHSWGAALAIEYALKHKNKLKSLILASPFLSAACWVRDSRNIMKLLPHQDREILIQADKNKNYNSKVYLEALEQYYCQCFCRLKNWPKSLKYTAEHINSKIYKTMWGESEYSISGNLKNFNRVDKIQHLLLPMLITRGYYDEVSEETVTKAVGGASHIEVITYQVSSHTAFWEEKERYLIDLNQFLDTN